MCSICRLALRSCLLQSIQHNSRNANLKKRRRYSYIFCFNCGLYYISLWLKQCVLCIHSSLERYMYAQNVVTASREYAYLLIDKLSEVKITSIINLKVRPVVHKLVYTSNHVPEPRWKEMYINCPFYEC